MDNKIFIYKNNTHSTNSNYDLIEKSLIESGFIINNKITGSNLIACVGGDGTLLHAMHDLDFPNIPIIGINTGHLGFFQEISPDEISDFAETYFNKTFKIQKTTPISATIKKDNYNSKKVFAINEIIIRSALSAVTHFSVYIDNTLIQEFSGDGILVSTPVGSTAYNYSLGGSLISPELDVLQITPIAPMNTNAYRSFRSSIMFPAKKEVLIKPSFHQNDLSIHYDGMSKKLGTFSEIKIEQSTKEISIIRFPQYDYWQKLKGKLL